MVNASVRQSARGVSTALEERNLLGVAALATLGVGGLFLAQEVTDQIMPMLGFSSSPSSAAGLGANALVKIVFAALVVALGSRGSSTMMAVAGTLAFGMLVSAGLDFVDMAQRGGLPGNAPVLSAASGSPSPSPTPAPKPKPTPSPKVSKSATPRPTRRKSTSGSGSFR